MRTRIILYEYAWEDIFLCLKIGTKLSSESFIKGQLGCVPPAKMALYAIQS